MISTGEKYRMRCLGKQIWVGEPGFRTLSSENIPSCGWTGVRTDHIDCECYDLYAFYCRPLTPGPGCPRGINWPCPRCKGAVTGKPIAGGTR
jgi:hypothetical protein